MVAGGLLLTSYTTRLTPFTSLAIRLEMWASTSGGNGNQSAVIPSRLVTARSADGLVVGPEVALDAHRADRQQHGERLPDVVVQTRRADLLDVDRVRPRGGCPVRAR